MVAPNVAGTPTSGGGGFGNQSVNYPASHAAGELFLLYVVGFHYGTVGTFAASGFTELGTHVWTGPVDGSDWRMSWFGRIRTGSEGSSVTVTQSQSAYMNVGMLRIADADVSGTITAAVDVTPTVTGNGRGATATMVQTTTVTNDATYFAHGTPYDNAFSSTPSGFTQEVSDSNAQRIWSKEMASAGATGTPTMSLSGTDDWMVHGIAIKPAGGGGGWDGSFIRLANGNLARVRMANGDAASVRLANGNRL